MIRSIEMVRDNTPYRTEHAMPRLPVQSWKTYQIAQPLSTHFRSATCEEVECRNMQNGWVTRLEEADPDNQQRIHYIRALSGRVFKEERKFGRPPTKVKTYQEAGHSPEQIAAICPEVWYLEFTFGPGQKCFAQHKLSLERPALYVVRDGDWRGNPTGNVRKLSGDNWVDDFANHQDRLSTAYERG